MSLIFFHPQKGRERDFHVKGHRLVENDGLLVFATLISVHLIFICGSLCFKFDRHYYEMSVCLWVSTKGLRNDCLLVAFFTYAAFNQEVFQKAQSYSMCC